MTTLTPNVRLTAPNCMTFSLQERSWVGQFQKLKILKILIFGFLASGQTEARFELLVVMFYPEGSYLSPLGSRTGFQGFSEVAKNSRFSDF